MTDNQYVSFYIYYAEPWESLLIAAVDPLVRRLLDEELITQYFFIRYWEKGPHIRLRLKIKPETDANELSQIIRSDLEKFILKNPSELFPTPEMEKIKVSESWRENNQIFLIDYQPEIQRYGGTHALPLVELQFFASSQMILHELKTIGDWSYDHALGTAIKLHVSFVFALGWNKELAAAFFEKNAKDWFPCATTEEGNTEQQEKILTQFQNAYQTQKATVLPYIHGIWQELEKQSLNHGSAAWSSWLSVNQSVYTNLQLLDKGNLLEKKATTQTAEPYLWNILSDLVHLTNNRLGVLNRDEGFLAFMLAKALKGPLDIR